MVEYENEQKKQIAIRRSVMDYGMGVIITLMGVYFLVYEHLDINIFRSKPSDLDKFIGVLFILYGIWRIYRGFKKNYFK